MVKLRAAPFDSIKYRKVSYTCLDRQFLDLERQLAAVRNVAEAGRFILGDEVGIFERALAELCQTRHAVAVASGTDALFLAIKAMGIGVGDDVLTVPNSFVSTAGAIAMTGARPVFVDVRDDYNMNPASVQEKITDRTRAILPVHLTGNPADMDALREIAKKFGLRVIEDAAQAISALYRGRSVGSLGDAACFSFHPLKNLNGWGDGGAVTTNDEKIARQIKLLRNHGLKNRDECAVFGFNSRLDTIQAAILLEHLKTLDSITAKRIQLAGRYDHLLADLNDVVTLPPRRDDIRQVFHMYVIRAKHREKLMAFLSDRGIETKIHYPIPIHLQEAAKDLGYRRGDFPVCESQAESILSLPVHQELEEEDIQYVVDQIKKFYNSMEN